MKRLITIILILALCVSLTACKDRDAKMAELNAIDISLFEDYDYSSNVIEKGTEFSFGVNEWDMYVVTAISDKLVRVVNWTKTSSDKPKYKEEEEIGVYEIDDPAVGFCWIDEQHSAFYMNLQDPNQETLKEGRPVPFSPLVASSDRNKGGNYDYLEVISYQYERDGYLYRAIPLSPTVVKVEVWRIHSGALFDKEVYAYDLLIINTENTTTDFEWVDDEYTSCFMTLRDPQNGNYWDEDELVYFICENDSLLEDDGDDVVNAPISSMDCEGMLYEEVVEAFEEVGFTNVEAVGSEIDYTDKVSDGSVVIVSINDESFEENATFDADAKVLIRYRIIKPRDESSNVSPEEGEVYTVSNCNELKELLEIKNPGAQIVADFADKYEGEVIEFKGNIANMCLHGDYDTRYDFLVLAGNYSETGSKGPNFKFEDVNCNDFDADFLTFPEPYETGKNVVVRAVVDEYNAVQQIMYLEPISMKIR